MGMTDFVDPCRREKIIAFDRKRTTSVVSTHAESKRYKLFIANMRMIDFVSTLAVFLQMRKFELFADATMRAFVRQNAND